MVVIPIRCGQQQCGKHVLDSKKRWFWIFSAENKEYTVQLIVSYLSGKKKIIINGVPAFSDQNVLNVNLDYAYTIGNNCLNIALRKNVCQMRVNNRPFVELFEKGRKDAGGMKGKEDKREATATTTTTTTTTAADPFSEFTNFANCEKQEEGKTATEGYNGFGEFDMDFKFEKQMPLGKNVEKKEVMHSNLITNKENRAIPNYPQIDEDSLFGTNAYEQMSKNSTAIIGEKRVSSEYYFVPEPPFGVPQTTPSSTTPATIDLL